MNEIIELKTSFRIGGYLFEGPFYRGPEVPFTKVCRLFESPYNDELRCEQVKARCPTKGRIVKDLRLEEWLRSNWNGGNGWKRFEISDGQTYADMPTLKKMESDVNSILKNSALGFLAKLPEWLKINVGTKLDAVVRLLEGYCSLGLSRSLERDDAFRALLYGAGSIVRGFGLEEIAVKLLDDAEKNLSAVDLSRFYDVPEARIGHLEEIIGSLQARVWRNEADESLRPVETTLQLIETYENAKGVH